MNPFWYAVNNDDDGMPSSSSGTNDPYPAYQAGSTPSGGYQDTPAGSYYGSPASGSMSGYGSAPGSASYGQYPQTAVNQYPLPATPSLQDQQGYGSSSHYPSYPGAYAGPSTAGPGAQQQYGGSGAYASYPGRYAGEMAGVMSNIPLNTPQASLAMPPPAPKAPAEAEAVDTVVPVNASRISVLVVPDSIYLPERQAPSGEERTYIKVHLLVPSSTTAEQIGWTRDAVEAELRLVMLQKARVANVLFNGRRARAHHGTEMAVIYDPRSLIGSENPEDVDQDMLEKYVDWSSFQFKDWDTGMKNSRKERGVHRTPILAMDMHALSKDSALAAMAEYMEQGGVVYTDDVQASQAWTAERVRRSSHFPFGNLKKQEARLEFTRSSVPIKGRLGADTTMSYERLMLEPHAQTFLVLESLSRETRTAQMRYYMSLSARDRPDLDAYLTQRSVVTEKVRSILSDQELYVGALSPPKRLEELIEAMKTERGSLSLLTARKAKEMLAEVKKAKGFAISGSVQHCLTCLQTDIDGPSQ